MIEALKQTGLHPFVDPDGLRSYQRGEVDRAWVPRWAFYFPPRMGKTRASTHTVRQWIALGVRRIFVTGPLEPLNDVWLREFRAIGCLRPSEAGERIAHLVPLTTQMIAKDRRIGKTKGEKRLVPSRVNVLKDLARGAAGEMPVIVLLNDEVLGRPIRPQTKTDPNPPRVIDYLLDWGPQALIGDESHRYQHAGAQRSAALRRLADRAQYVRLLSGTPDPKKAISFYHQFRILDPTVFGTSKKRFLQDHCFTAGRYGEQIIGYRDLGRVFDLVRSRATIIRPEDYFPDVPARDEVVREPDFDAPDVRTWYRKLAKEMVLEVDGLGITVTANHILSRLIRCQQLTSGFLEDKDGNVVWLHDTKIKAVVADASEILASGQKLVVVHRFVEEGPRIVAALRRAYGERTVLALDAKTRDRIETIKPFSLDYDVESDARILVKSEKIGGQGISLGRADYLTFTSHSFNYDDVEQNRMRIWHEDKKRIVVSFITIPHTVDGKALKNIREKGDNSIMVRSASFEQLVGIA